MSWELVSCSLFLVYASCSICYVAVKEELVSCSLFLVYASCSICYVAVKEKETTNCFLSEKIFYFF
jgi:hypothetical protein